MTQPISKSGGWLAELRRRKVVRVAIVYLIGAWIAIQVAAETFEPIGLPAWTVRLVIVLAALGLPLALALAWAFDVTPRGIERTPPWRRDEGSATLSGATTIPAPPRSLAAITPPSAAVPADDASSVAILPFVDMSPEHDQDYFCDGIAEEIINTLCCVSGLKIASRTSAFQFKGRAADVREIGRALGVKTVLEGSVRKAGNRVRVTAQLVNAGDGYHLWSETFDRRLEDVFAIQTEIAQQITRALRVSLSSGESARLGRGGTSNPDAYEYYLRGRALLRDHSDTAMTQAAQMFRRSIAIDPDFALAHAGLADSLAMSVFWHAVKNPGDISAALAAVSRAEDLQPGLAEVMVSRGSLLSAQHLNVEAEAAFEEAIARAPNLADAFYWYGRHAYGAGDHRKAVALFERTMDLDPTNYKACGLLSSALEVIGETERSTEARTRAVELIDRHLELYPDDVRALHIGAVTHAGFGNRARSLELGERALALRPNEFATLYNVACAYAQLGEKERALDLLERSIDMGWGSADWLRSDADLKNLRDDPRFGALLARVERGGGS